MRFGHVWRRGTKCMVVNLQPQLHPCCHAQQNSCTLDNSLLTLSHFSSLLKCNAGRVKSHCRQFSLIMTVQVKLASMHSEAIQIHLNRCYLKNLPLTCTLQLFLGHHPNFSQTMLKGATLLGRSVFTNVNLSHRLFFFLIINSTLQLLFVNLAYGQDLTDVKIYYNNYDTGKVTYRTIRCIVCMEYTVCT